MYGLKTESSFDAAHFLTDYHGKCENLARSSLARGGLS